MRTLTSFIRLLVLALSLGLVASVDLPTAHADSGQQSACAKRKKKRHKKRRKKRRARRKKKARRGKRVTARKVARWWNAGLSEKAIMKKVVRARWKPTAKDIKRLRKQHLSAELIDSLSERVRTTVAVADTRPRKFERVQAGDDVDFDSVPPPQGMPRSVSQPKTKAKTLDRSLRPSAPFDEKDKADNDGAKTGRRRVIVAAE